MSVIGFAFISTNFLIVIISSFRLSSHYEELMNIYNDSITKNKKLQKTMPTFDDQDFATVYEYNLKNGMDKLGNLAHNVRIDFETGGVTINHHDYLIENINSINGELRNRLGERVLAYAKFYVKKLHKKNKINKKIYKWASMGYLPKDYYLEIDGILK